MRFRFFLATLLFLWLFSVVGCGNKGDGPDTVIPPTNGIVSDPYIYGAAFTEYDASGKVLQVSHEFSDERGRFLFLRPVSAGSTIVMNTVEGVRHVTPDGSSLEYNGPLLRRKVNSAPGEGVEMVVTPMTTLAALLQEQAQEAGTPITEEAAKSRILGILTANDIPGVTAENIFTDPMAPFAEGGDKNPALVQASLALGTALKFGTPSVESSELNDILKNAYEAIALAMAAPDADENTLLQAGAIISNEVLKKENQDDAVSRIDELKRWLGEDDNAVEFVEKVESTEDKAVFFDADDDIELIVSDYQGLFDTYFAAAKGALDSIYTQDATTLEYDLAPADELLAMANNFDAAKRTYQEAQEKNAVITVAQEDLDLLNFFYAFSRVLLLANPFSDNNDTNGLQRLSDLLDAMQVDKTTNVRAADFGLQTCVTVTDPILGDYEDCTSNVFRRDALGNPIVPETPPNAAQLQAFLYQLAGNELKSSISALNAVSESFNIEQMFSGELTEFDYSDVLFVKAYANFLLFQIHFQQGVNVNGDIKSAMQSTTTTIEQYLNAHPDLLKVTDANALDAAREYAGVGLKGLYAAIAAVENESDQDSAQDNDFVTFYGDPLDPLALQEMQEEIAAAKAEISRTMPVFYREAQFPFDNDTQTATVNLNSFFSGAVSLRGLLPGFTGNMPGLFPDPLMAGMVSANLDLNADAHADGTADVIQSKVVKFTPLMFRNKTYVSRVGMDPTTLIQFTDSAFEFSDMYGATLDSGTWTISPDAQRLILTAQETRTVILEDGELEDGLLVFDVNIETTDGIFPGNFDELMIIDGLSPELLSGRQIYGRTSDYSASLEVALNFDGTYTDPIQAVSGTWSIVNGALVLTPSTGTPSTYNFVKGYETEWGEKFLVLDLNGTATRFFCNLW